MTKTRLYIARHGKTMFNALTRAQGWCDTPLTPEGEEGIRELGRGLKESGLDFKLAFSSDSGRTIQTMGLVLEELGHPNIPYTYDKRIREWCFGSFEGSYDAELFGGVMPRILPVEHVHQLSYAELADALVEVDTANWAQPWEVLRQRIYEGFEDIAKQVEELGGGNAFIVSHGMTIGSFMWIIDPETPRSLGLQNGSVTVVEYENGTFTIDRIGDMTYRELGRKSE